MLTPKYPKMPPMVPFAQEPNLQAMRREMLLACLSGGMSYEDAVWACDKEYGERIAKAKKADEEMLSIWQKRCNEFYKENT